MNQKIFTPPELDSWVAAQRSRNRRIGFTCGAFDLLHVGHINLLEKAKVECDCLLVAVNSDRSIQAYKSLLRPIVSQDNRMRVLSALEAVDAVVLMDDVRPRAFIERWKPDLYIKGGDYSIKGLRSAAAVESFGGKVLLIPFVADESTTAIINRIGTLESHSVPALAQADLSRPIVFLDRDGTLIRDIPYLHDPERVQLLPGVGHGLACLQHAGFRLVIVTNQQGIGLGYYTPEQFYAVNQALFKKLSSFRVRIDRVYFCPHSMAANCSCRKPETGMLLRALREFQADPGQCWLLGDSDTDLEAGEKAGIRSIQIRGLSASESTFSQAVDQILCCDLCS